GFRSAIRQTASSNDPMVERCSRGRSPFFVNNPASDPRLSELLFDSPTERLMAAPLFSRGQLIGFLDIRDKRQKEPFDQQDVEKAQTIANRIIGLFANKNLWNQRFITLADAGPVPIPRAAPARAADSQSARPAGEPAPRHADIKIISDAHAAVSRIMSPVAPDKI